MKATVIRPTRYIAYRRNTFTRYPGAARRRKLAEKLMDAALAAAITVSIIVIAMFLLILA